MIRYFMVGTIHGGWNGQGAREMLDDWFSRASGSSAGMSWSPTRAIRSRRRTWR